MANRSEVGKRSRSKGKRGELSLVHALNPGRTPYPAGWRHTVTRELISATTGRQHHGGPESPDIRHNIKGIHVEVTHREDMSFYGGLTHWIPENGDTTTCKPAICSVRRQAMHSEEILQMSLPGFLRVLGYESVPDDDLDTIPIEDGEPPFDEEEESVDA